ncbi:hypothetical protein [Balneatrix alpica]|uniref:SPOR domain-containing protein n=1 Tax=Balneatrix alpica TaxID=75684 RepID=A0ABV5ZFN7_9GAMM|nr:hypothetical protein [Balneatrix alpica]
MGRWWLPLLGVNLLLGWYGWQQWQWQSAAPLSLPVLAAKQVRLLSELSPEALSVRPPVQQGECPAWLFSDEHQARYWQQWWQQYGVNLPLRAVQANLPGDYWVYASPPDGQQQQRLQGLAKLLKVEMLPINQGELRGYWSLGVYGRHSLAEWVKQQAVEAGLEAKVHLLSRYVQQWQLPLSEAELQALSNKLISQEKILPQVEKIPCDRVASG